MKGSKINLYYDEYYDYSYCCVNGKIVWDDDGTCPFSVFLEAKKPIISVDRCHFEGEESFHPSSEKEILTFIKENS